MLRPQIKTLINDYGVKREAIIQTIDTTRPTFLKKMKDNSFDQIEKVKLYAKYGALL